MESKKFLIIVDRNPHVRRFLVREFSRQGFDVSGYGDVDTVSAALGHVPGNSLLIVDPDLPGQEMAAVIGQVLTLKKGLPVIIHSHFRSGLAECELPGHWVVVEKSGNFESLSREVLRLAGRR